MDAKTRTRFEAKIDRSGGVDACWPWTASLGGSDYGQFANRGGSTRVAHRIAYELHTGERIPRGLQVLHRCDVRLCCNPVHLFLGTQLDNIRDMDAKGRRVSAPCRGEKHGRAKLTGDKVREIRSLRGVVKQRDLATRFGVSRSVIAEIMVGRIWQHV